MSSKGLDGRQDWVVNRWCWSWESKAFWAWTGWARSGDENCGLYGALIKFIECLKTMLDLNP
jgi:hypothetical protein